MTTDQRDLTPAPYLSANRQNYPEPMRTLRVVDPTFLDTAPIRDHLVQTLPVSAAAAFRCFEDGDAWGEWIPAIESVTWTSPKPYGVGTTRTVSLTKGGIDEEFFIWEEGKRMAFFFVGADLPLIKAFAEDYVLTPRGDDQCELRWNWALAAGPLGRVFNMGFKRSGRTSLSNLEHYLRANPEKYV